jgi:hypothetical protein
MQHLSRHRVGSKTEALRLLSQGHARRSNLQTAIGSSSSRVRPIPSRGHCLLCPRSHSLWTAAWLPRAHCRLPCHLARRMLAACSACEGMCAAHVPSQATALVCIELVQLYASSQQSQAVTAHRSRMTIFDLPALDKVRAANYYAAQRVRARTLRSARL